MIFRLVNLAPRDRQIDKQAGRPTYGQTDEKYDPGFKVKS